jgi:hypothetical protein
MVPKLAHSGKQIRKTLALNGQNQLDASCEKCSIAKSQGGKEHLADNKMSKAN